MKNTIKFALLPCLGILALAAAPAQAVSITSNGSTAATLTSGTSAGISMTKQQLKQQAKLRKQCAKLGSSKLSSKKRAQLTSMCASAASQQVGKPAVPASIGTPAPSSTGISTPESSQATSPAVATLYTAAALYVPAAAAPEKSEDAVSLATDTTSVPEPGSLALLGLGLIGLGLARRRIGK